MKNKLYLILILTFVSLLFFGCQAPDTPEADNKEENGADNGDTVEECEHIWIDGEILFPGTCSVPKKITQVCSACSKTRTVFGEKNPDIHVFGDWYTVSAPNCTDVGEAQRRCNDCEATESMALEPDGMSHTIITKTVFSSCTETGSVTEECTRCDYESVTSLPIDQKAHKYGDDYFVSDIGHAYICSLCGTHGEQLPHKESDWLTSDAAHYKSCADCKGIYSYAEHQNTTVTNEPTYKDDGFSYEICDVCRHISGEQTLERLPQLTPDYTVPEPIRCTYGMRLGDISLPAGFSFSSDLSLSVGTVGTHKHLASYTVPNDNEEKYLTVYNIEITLTVEPKPILLSADFSALDCLTYSGEAAPSPTIPDELLHLTRVDWYSESMLLSGAPTNAGRYTVRVISVNANYSAEALVYEFEIRKAKCPITSEDIRDKFYTGEGVRFDFEGNEGVTLEFSDLDGSAIEAPIDIGEYRITVTVEPSKNYEGTVIVKNFKILADTEGPVWDSTVIYLPPQSEKYTLSASDNGKISYYHVNAYRPAYYGAINYVTRESEITVEYGTLYTVTAYDMCGNGSGELYIYVQPEGEYAPSNVSPANEATVTESYARLYAEGASEYYFGSSRDNLIYLDSDFIPSLRSGQTYYWQARCGALSSPIYSFTVAYDGEIAPVCISPEDGAEIYDRIPELIGTASDDGKIYYARYDSSVFIELSSETQLQYGVKYKWYVGDASGARSEERSFTYLYNSTESEDAIYVNADFEISYVNTPYLTVSVSSLSPLDRILYMTVSADGSSSYVYSSAVFVKENGRYYGSLSTYDIEKGDTVYVYAVDIHQSVSAAKTFVIDAEAPVCGEISTAENKILITVGSDNVGARYYYRVNMGEWTEYTKDTRLNTDGGQVFVELHARDHAGNEDYSSGFIGESELLLPTVTLTGGKLGEYVNTDVALTVTPAYGYECYYYVDGERFSLTEEISVVLGDEGVHYFLVSAVHGDTEIYSEPQMIMIDKTAPELGELIYPRERFNINGTYTYILLDSNKISDATDVKLYYQMLGVNSERKDYYGRVPLYSYYIAESGTYLVEITAVDAAGNESTKTAELIIDAEGPTIGEVKLDRIPDEESGTTKYIINLKDIRDTDGGYYYHMHFQIWDQNAYENGLESIVNLSFYTEEGESEFIYDASHLPDGDTYYFLAYVTDDLINAGESTLYRFYKYNLLTTVEIDGYLFEYLDGEYSLFAYEGEDTELTLPESVRGLGYSISSQFMSGNTEITSVVIPKGVTAIGGSAFENCTSLRSLVIPSTIRSIGNSAFYGCSALTHIDFEAELEYFGNYAFYGIPTAQVEGITAYEGGYYLGSTENPYMILLSLQGGATELVIPENTKFIAAEACFSRRALTSVSLPSSIVSIGSSAFAYSGITSIDIPDGVREIPNQCFFSCSSLAQVTLGEGIEYIGDDAFYSCSSLPRVTLGEGIEYIGDSAFCGCTALEKIVIGEGVGYIGHGAFADCTALREIHIDSAELTLGSRAFSGCYGVEYLYYNADTTVVNGDCYEARIFESLGKDGLGTEIVIGKSVKAIPEFFFYTGEMSSKGNIISIIFEDGAVCESIGDQAFRGFNVTEIILPEGLRVLGNHVFNGCDMLTSLVIPNSIESVGDIRLESLEYTSVGTARYLGNSSNPYLVLVSLMGDTESLTVHSDTKIICSLAFTEAQYLSSVVISSSVINAGTAFWFVSNLEHIFFSDTEGWYLGDESIDSSLLADSEAAANLLKSNYDTLHKKSTS